MPDLILIQTTVDTSEAAKKLARHLLEKHLAACIQISETQSHYYWQGELCCSGEWLLSIKTEISYFDEVNTLLSEQHPYEVPEIVALPIVKSSKAYKDWVLKTIGGATAE